MYTVPYMEVVWVIHLFQINDQQTGFGLQLQLEQIKVFPLQIQIIWDDCDLCIHHPFLGLPLQTSQYLWYWIVVANGPGPWGRTPGRGGWWHRGHRHQRDGHQRPPVGPRIESPLTGDLREDWKTRYWRRRHEVRNLIWKCRCVMVLCKVMSVNN